MGRNPRINFKKKWETAPIGHVSIQRYAISLTSSPACGGGGFPVSRQGCQNKKRASAKNKRWLKTIFPLYAQCAPCLRRLWMAVPMASIPARSSAYAMGMGSSNRPPVNGSVVNGVTVLRKTGASVFPS